MSLFKALAKVATLPVRVLEEIADDVKKDDDGGAAALAIITLGASSAVKAVVKTAQDVVEELTP